MDLNELLKPGWCCACGRRIPEDSEANVVMLENRARWPFPTWHHHWPYASPDTAGLAIAMVCDFCFSRQAPPKYAVQIVGTSRIYHNIRKLTDREQMTLDELEVPACL